MDAATRQYIRTQIDAISRTRVSKAGNRILQTHESWVREVDDAIFAYRKDGQWPPVAHLPLTRADRKRTNRDLVTA